MLQCGDPAFYHGGEAIYLFGRVARCTEGVADPIRGQAA
jgi:hypothetical protein